MYFLLVPLVGLCLPQIAADLSDILLGTGKSVLLRAIIQALGGPSPTVAVTASTGIAAVNIGGQTLHSFAGAYLELPSHSMPTLV